MFCFYIQDLLLKYLMCCKTINGIDGHVLAADFAIKCYEEKHSIIYLRIYIYIYIFNRGGSIFTW